MKSQAIKYLNSLATDETTKKELDLIDFIKKCVREFKEKEPEPQNNGEIYFEKLWELYPRKINKQLAKRTFQKKIKGLNEEECKDKCNKIYKAQMMAQQQWKNEGRELKYIPHYSSWLNAVVPDGK